MLFSDVSGRKVVSTANAETIGKVDDFVIDPASRSVIALLLKKTESGDTLTYANLEAVGSDAVTVKDASAITEATGRVAELNDKDHRAMGKRVLTTLGDEIGKIKDIDFDPADGGLVSLRVDKQDVAGAKLIGVGSYAVVVDL